MSLWPRNKPMSQPPHYGGLSLSAGKAQRAEPHFSIAVKNGDDDSTSPNAVSDESDNQEQG